MTKSEASGGRYAERLVRIEPFRVMELVEHSKRLEAQGAHVVHMEVGEADFPTAAPIVDAAHRALNTGCTKYTQALGLPELREEIARFYKVRYGLDIAASRIIVTSGASAGLLLLSAAQLNPGDELLITDPGYPCNEVFAHLVNAEPVRIPVDARNGFLPTPSAIERYWTRRSRALLLASPANPTGAMLSADELRAIAAFVQSRGVLWMDEIYQGLTYTSAATQYGTVLTLTDEAYVLQSFSKYFGMTGWRLGWMVVPEASVEPLTRLAQNLFICPPTVSQYAALAAFSPEALAEHERRRVAFESRRRVLVDGLRAAGLHIAVEPAGAFYVYADISGVGLNSTDFCWRLLNDYHVACTPGTDFGLNGADHHVRFAFTTDQAQLEQGVARIAQALSDWSGR